MNKIIPGYDCVADVRRIREELVAEHGGDLDRIFDSLATAEERYWASFTPEERALMGK